MSLKKKLHLQFSVLAWSPFQERLLTCFQMWPMESGKRRLCYSLQPVFGSHVKPVALARRPRATVCSCSRRFASFPYMFIMREAAVQRRAVRVRLLVFLIATRNPLDHLCASRSDSHSTERRTRKVPKRTHTHTYTQRKGSTL